MAAVPASGRSEPVGFGTGLLHRVVAHLLAGHDAVVINPLGGGPVLDLLSSALTARACAVVRVDAGLGSGVASVVAQVTGRANGAEGHGAVQQMMDKLCRPPAGCDRVVLLVAQADRLDRGVLRLLDQAAKTGPLQFVLAAPDDPLVKMDRELAPLHNRIAAFHPLVIEPGTPLAVLVPQPVASAPRAPEAVVEAAPGVAARRWRAREWLSLVGAVACLVVFAGVGPYLLVPAAPKVAEVAVDAPATAVLAAGVDKPVVSTASTAAAPGHDVPIAAPAKPARAAGVWRPGRHPRGVRTVALLR